MSSKKLAISQGKSEGTVQLLKTIFILPLIWLVVLIYSLSLYLLAYLPKTFSGRHYHYLSRLWCRLFIRAMGIEFKLIYRNTKPLPDHFILIGNHPSALEDFAIPGWFDIYPLAKKEVRDWLVLGRISDYAGSIYVDRESSQSRHAALESMVDAIEEGKNIVIFPEGGCKGRRIYSQFKTGAFDISLQTGVPILPVFLHYVDEDVFEWNNETLVRKLWQIYTAENKQVNYYVHDMLSPGNYVDKETFAENARQKFLQWEKEYILEPVE